MNNVKRLCTLFSFYVALLILFEVDRLCFMLFHAQGHSLAAADWLATWWHGLPLDMATAGYITAPLWLLLLVTLWARVPHLRLIYKVYAALASLLLSVIWIADICLYGFWGIKLDGTVWNYLDSPQGALSSVTPLYMAGVAVAVIVAAAVAFFLMNRLLFQPFLCLRLRAKCLSTMGWLLLGGMLFLGIRGGVGKSTANVGMVYYSDNQFLNHCAVNPAFSIFSSMRKTRNFADEHNFFDELQRRQLFDALGYDVRSVDTDSLLRTARPNVLIVLMEGCGGTFVHAVDSLSDASITPNLNRLAAEGVVFTECYANSFRTDRGTLTTLSGYAAFPDVSVMKIPSKCTHLPSIAKSLRNAGYSTEFLYGGDINFTNTNGYLIGTGYEHTYGDTSFPISVRRTHDWGVTDAITFDTLYNHIERQPTTRPWHIGYLTLASHEPWKVPYSRIPADKVANTMAYLDDCIGRFTQRLKKSRMWANTLVIFIPDHGINYPEGISDADPRRSHIPMIWAGGAVKQARRITALCNQSDLAATLLGQLGIAHSEFRFSRDVMSRSYTHPSAVHTWSEGIFYKDSTGVSVINVLSKPAKVMHESPQASPERQNAAKAYLQTIYDDLGSL